MGKRPAAQQPPSATLERRLLATVGNSGHAALDVDELAALLRDRFPEYKRQKAGPFAIQVDRALGALTAQGSLAGKVCHENFHAGADCSVAALLLWSCAALFCWQARKHTCCPKERWLLCHGSNAMH